jgi:hypothetical protein
MTRTVPTTAAPPDRVPAKGGAHLLLLDDLERHREGARLEGEGEILRLLEGLVPEGDLAPAVDPALDHRWRALNLVIEEDRHEVTDVAAGFGPELPAAGPVQFEDDDGAVGEWIELGLASRGWCR